MNDPIYGRVALMAPVGGSGPVRVELTMQKCLVTASFFLKPDATPTAIGQKLFQKVGATPTAIGEKLFQKVGATPTAIGEKVFEKPLATAVSDKFFQKPGTSPPTAPGGQVFVLSDRPVLGRNCVVVSSGFADLMDALQTSGGARVRMA
jgi:hypothetical protein